MADQKNLPQDSLSAAAHGTEAQGFGRNDVFGPARVAKIDKELLIDLNNLSIGSMISEGPYSIVYEGFYGSVPVAIKVIQPDISSNVSPERIEKFEREVMTLSRVKHDNIVKFIGAAMEPTLLIITELMKGGTLQKYLWNLRPNNPDMKLSLSYALGISRAMEYLHGHNIIHRDLKPSNLLLTEDNSIIKLADFGLAREEDIGEMTAEAGTYRWMAPELFSVDPVKYGGKKSYNHKVDVYSFSMVLWELLTNQTPFKGRGNIMVAYAAAANQRPSMDDIPMDIVPLLKSCWAQDPDDRPEFAQITEFLSTLLANMRSVQKTLPVVFNREDIIITAETPMNAADCLMKCRTNRKNKRKECYSRFLHCLRDCSISMERRTPGKFDVHEAKD